MDDSYNSNKNGFMAALDTLGMFKELRILMTPGMVELGEKQYSENKEVGVYAAAYLSLLKELYACRPEMTDTSCSTLLPPKNTPTVPMWRTVHCRDSYVTIIFLSWGAMWRLPR